MAKNRVLEPFHDSAHDHDHCIDEAMAAAEKICTDAEARLTPLRRRVLEMVWQSHEPVGAYDLLNQLQKEKSRAAPPTVYRALDFLLEHGLVHRIESLNAYVGCGEPQSHPHSHHGGQFLICHDCGSVAELDDHDISRTVVKKAEHQGFHVQRQTIEIMGLCPDCKDPPGESRHAT